MTSPAPTPSGPTPEAAPEDRELSLPRRFVYALSIYAAAMAVYFAGGHAAREPYVDLATPLDHVVPFVPAAMIGYAIVYVLPLAALWVETTAAGVRRMRRAILLAYAIAAPFFLAMPVQDADPPLEPATVLEQLLHHNREADTTKNAFPSMHVGAATVLALIGWRRSRRWGVALTAAATVIVVSTLLVKQHFFVDLPAGVVVGWIAFRRVYGPRPTDRRAAG